MPTSPAFAPGIYVNTTSGAIARWDVPSGTVSIVAQPGVTFTDIAFAPDGRLFAITSTQLFEISAATGAANLIGNLTGPLYFGVNALTGANGFAISASGRALITSSNNQVLAEVDLTTGAVRNVGTYGTNSAGDIAFVGETAVISTTSYNLQYMSPSTITTGYYNSGSAYTGSNAIYGLLSSPQGLNGLSSSGIVGFTGSQVVDLGVPGGIFGPGILATLPSVLGSVWGAAELRGTIVNPEAPQLSAAAAFAAFGQLGLMSKLALASYNLINERLAPLVNDFKPGATAAYSALDRYLDYLTAADLPALSPMSVANTFGSWGLREGIFVNQNAAALVARTADALFIAFRGTNDSGPGLPDLSAPDVGHWIGKDAHAALFASLLTALSPLLTGSGIVRVYVTGHSLGGSMVEDFMRDHPGVRFVGTTFASPGYGVGWDNTDGRVSNLRISGDVVPIAGTFAESSGDMNTIYPGGAISFGNRHSMLLHDRIVEFLSDNGIDRAELTGRALRGIDYDDIYLAADGRSDASEFWIGRGNDDLFAATSDAILLGGDGNDGLFGQSGRDHLLGGAGNDNLFGGTAADWLGGGDNNDRLDGGIGADTLVGGQGRDRLNGSLNADSLSGGAGNDILDGGKAQDLLTGGTGADVFVFSAASHTGSTLATADRITDFQSTGLVLDVIDLAGVDARTDRLLNQSFSFLGTGAFTGTAGELRVKLETARTIVMADRDGDQLADFFILLDGAHQLGRGDFIL